MGGSASDFAFGGEALLGEGAVVGVELVADPAAAGAVGGDEGGARAGEGVEDDFAGLEGCNEILNVTRPDVVEAIHAAYLDAGADFVGMGGKLVDEKRIAAGDKEAIMRAARDALGLMQA